MVVEFAFEFSLEFVAEFAVLLALEFVAVGFEFVLKFSLVVLEFTLAFALVVLEFSAFGVEFALWLFGVSACKAALAAAFRAEFALKFSLVAFEFALEFSFEFAPEFKAEFKPEFMLEFLSLLGLNALFSISSSIVALILPCVKLSTALFHISLYLRFKNSTSSCARPSCSFKMSMVFLSSS